MHEWQDIATAPKDGTWIVVSIAGKPTWGVHAMRWDGNCDAWADGENDYATAWFNYATHWLPLPQPPDAPTV